MPQSPKDLLWLFVWFCGIAVGTFAFHWIKGETVKEKLDKLNEKIEADRAQTESLNRKMVRVEKHITATPTPMSEDPQTYSGLKP